MAEETTEPQGVSLFEALEALEKVKIHILQQERDKNRMTEEYARLRAEQDSTDTAGG